jgi:tetratricopeptide (TPR) repeat protein
VGQQLNASFVLGGSVRRAGNRLRITAQLIETRTGHSVWAERYDREMKDVFEVQDDIARSISQALRITLSPQEEKAIARKPTDNPQAYDYYLRGRQFLYKHSREGQKEARQLFARAIVIDPQYARAYAGVADCCSFLYMYHEATEANLKEAEMASQRAVELDPDSAEAHASRGLALSVNKRYDEAAQEFETAIRLNPNLYEAYYFYARTRFAEGKMEEAAGLYEQAGRVNPEDYQVPALLGQVYRSLGRLVDLRAAQRRVLALVEKHVAAQPSDARALYLGAGAACELGEKTRGLEWARRALEIDPNDTSTLYNVACVYSLEGLVEEGLECLEKAVERGFGHKEWIEHDSDLDALRSDPRFQSLLRRLNFPD